MMMMMMMMMEEVRRELSVCWVLSLVSRLWSVYRTVHCCDVLTVGQRVE